MTAVQKVEKECGDIPAPRFGHTATLVGSTRVVLFGGATGDSGRYTITADTYSLDISTGRWDRVTPEPGGKLCEMEDNRFRFESDSRFTLT